MGEYEFSLTRVSVYFLLWGLIFKCLIFLNSECLNVWILIYSIHFWSMKNLNIFAISFDDNHCILGKQTYLMSKHSENLVKTNRYTFLLASICFFVLCHYFEIGKVFLLEFDTAFYHFPYAITRITLRPYTIIHKTFLLHFSGTES